MLYDGTDQEVVRLLRSINAVALMFCTPPYATQAMLNYYQSWQAQSWQWGGKPGGLHIDSCPHVCVDVGTLDMQASRLAAIWLRTS